MSKKTYTGYVQGRKFRIISVTKTAIQEKAATVISFFPRTVRITATAKATAAEMTEDVEKKTAGTVITVSTENGM